MNTNISTKRIRTLAFIEGTSLLLLVFIAVPLKHIAHIPIATRIMGLIHGLAFLAYVATILDALATRRLPKRAGLTALLLAFVPGGSFFFAHRIREHTETKS